ncbi:hypothetical protein BJP62_05245 [Jeongeupia sp. USM3]|nr:hypothetical protein BJP62_05245 [Jeongeupia sp. USM3]
MVVNYAYDSSGRLSGATYPDNSQRQYAYEDGSNPYLLTGITDENGIRFASWSYNAQGQAVSSQHAGGVGRMSLSFGGDPANGTRWTDETDALGSVRRFNFQQVAKQWLLTGKNQPGGAGCSAATGTLEYDVNGNVKNRTDFNGNTANYAYDLARNLETSRTEAAGTPQARTISTEWHASFRLPTKVTEPGRVTTFEYDASGNLLKKSVTADGATRISSWTYGNYGLVASATDPAGKVTQYSYDAQGNLSTLTNPLGQITRFPRYDALGNVLEMVEPNGQTTTFGYDLRQRLLSRTTAGETTSFSYLPTGLLSQVRFADNRTVSYRYDPAHRLIGIDDSRGNRIDYTLDAMGNRLREDRLDPAGTLAASLQQVSAQQNVPNQIANP